MLTIMLIAIFSALAALAFAALVYNQLIHIPLLGLRQTFADMRRGERLPEFSVHPWSPLSILSGEINETLERIEKDLASIQRTEAVRKEVTANVSHDFRGPLTSIQGYVETLIDKDSTLTVEERREFLEIVLSNTLSLKTMVTELLDLAKFDARTVVPKKRAFAAAELAQQIIGKYQARAKSKQIALAVQIAPRLPEINADFAMLDRALSNIVENAIYYTPRGGNVHVAFDAKQETIIMEVADNGIGIPETDLPYIFERFYRVNKDRSKSTGGTGLGLAIAKKIIDAHNGMISVTSTVNKGTKVLVQLKGGAPSTAE